MWQSEYDTLNSFQQIVEICNLKAQHEQLCKDFRKEKQRDVPWPFKSLSGDAVMASNLRAMAPISHPLNELHEKYRYLMRRIEQAKVAVYSIGDK